jgi:hypothetical protein
MSIQAQAAAAALSGDRQFLQFQSVDTGDRSGNLILACLAAVAACQTTGGETVEVLEYLVSRYKRGLDNMKAFQFPQGIGAGQIGTPLPAPAFPTPSFPGYGTTVSCNGQHDTMNDARQTAQNVTW